MTEFWDFFLDFESGDQTFKVLITMMAGLLAVLLLTLLEEKSKRGGLFLMGNSLTAAAVTGLLLLFGAGLSELLVWLLLFLLVRILRMMWERREHQ